MPPPTGADLLLCHEVGWTDALRAANVPVVEEPAETGAAATLALPGTDGPIALIDVAGVVDDDALAFAAEVIEVLAATVQRHWAEVQIADRVNAFREAQRHTQVGCFEWDIAVAAPAVPGRG